MCNFIQDYLDNPSQAISAALAEADSLEWLDNVDDDIICSQISSPEFRLYENIILSMPADDDRHAETTVRPVA